MSQTDLKRCNQCWQRLPKSAFQGPKANHEYQDCSDCRKRGRKPVENHRTGLPTSGPLKVLFTERSGNVKLGPIPSCKVTASTCPPSCSWFNQGCFGESHMLREHWRDLEFEGMGWGEFLSRIERLPSGQVWRYAEVGDLPGIGESIDEFALLALIDANTGSRGFTYTHKLRDLGMLRQYITHAKLRGFTINASCDSLEQVDSMKANGFNSLVVTLPHDAPDKLITPMGYTVKVCWAENDPNVNCSRCRACANPMATRPVIGFRAHGQAKAWVSKKATTPAYETAKRRGLITIPVVK